MTDQAIALKGREAQQLLDNPLLAEAIESMRAQVVQQWKECPIRDKEGQTLLLQLAKVTDKFEGILRGTIETGKLAQRRIDFDKLRDEPSARQFMRKVFNG